MLLAEILGGILIAIIGGRIGLYALYFVTVAFAAGFSALSANKLLFQAMSTRLNLITSKEISIIVTFLFLTLVPILVIVYYGLKIAKKINFSEWLTPVSSAVLGSAYFLTIYIIILYLLGI